MLGILSLEATSEMHRHRFFFGRCMRCDLVVFEGLLANKSHSNGMHVWMLDVCSHLFCSFLCQYIDAMKYLGGSVDARTLSHASSSVKPSWTITHAFVVVIFDCVFCSGVHFESLFD